MSWVLPFGWAPGPSLEHWPLQVSAIVSLVGTGFALSLAVGDCMPLLRQKVRERGRRVRKRGE